MDNDFMGKLQQVLSNPEAMAKITSIASGLGATGTPSAAPDTAPPAPSDISPPLPSNSGAGTDASNALSPLMPSTQGDPRVSLLYSLKPLLREEKRDRVDALARALAIASMMKNFRK